MYSFYISFVSCSDCNFRLLIEIIDKLEELLLFYQWIRMTWINYQHLHYFLVIAESGSVSSAAIKLRLGQSTLSSQLKSLEEQLGTLFERRNRRLVLNERGHVVLRYAREIFNRGDELLRVLDRGELASQSQILLGAQEGVPKAILANVISKLLRVTKARIIVREGEATFLIEEVVKGHLDLLVTDHELSNKAGMIYIPVSSERIGIWSSTKSPSSSGKFPDCLNGQPFILPSPGHSLRMRLENFFLENNIVPNIFAEVPDTALIKELGIQGMGLIVLGEATVKSWVSAGRLKLVWKLPFSQTYWLGLPRKSLKDPLLEDVVNEFKSKIKH